jgi:hypothetical protein
MKKTFELVNIGGKHFIKRKGEGNCGIVVRDKTGAQPMDLSQETSYPP